MYLPAWKTTANWTLTSTQENSPLLKAGFLIYQDARGSLSFSEFLGELCGAGVLDSLMLPSFW